MTVQYAIDPINVEINNKVYTVEHVSSIRALASQSLLNHEALNKTTELKTSSVDQPLLQPNRNTSNPFGVMVPSLRLKLLRENPHDYR